MGGNLYLENRGQGRIYRGLWYGMRGLSSRGRPKNWRSQQPNFGPRYTSISMRPRYLNWMQILMPRRFIGIGNWCMCIWRQIINYLLGGQRDVRQSLRADKRKKDNNRDRDEFLVR